MTRAKAAGPAAHPGGASAEPGGHSASAFPSRSRGHPRSGSLAPEVPAGDWAIVLFATRGVRDFVENALISIERCGIDMALVHLVLPGNAKDELTDLARRFGATPRRLDRRGSRAGRMPAGYLDYGTEAFNRLMTVRFPLIRTFLEEGRRVIYADVDVAWLRNPLPYLEEVLKHFPFAAQTEAAALFPPPFCTGFFAVRPAPESLDLIDRHIAVFAKRRARDPKLTMQNLFCQLIAEQPGRLASIFPLPEGLFPNGLLHRVVRRGRKAPLEMAGRLDPFIFHSNWTIGLDNKRRLMKHAGTWFVPAGSDG